MFIDANGPKVCRVWYYKKKNRVYGNIAIDDQVSIKMFEKYEQDTKRIWNCNRSYGTRVFWQERSLKPRR